MGGKGSRFRFADYIKISIFGFALSALWTSLGSIILPLRILDFVAEPQKNTYLGLLTFVGLVIAILVQPAAGAVSDRSNFKWGRRRPYILVGAIGAMLLLPGIGVSGSYAAIFIVYCLLQISCNVAQGPFQAFIPDLVPRGKRGLASGVLAIMGIVGAVAYLRLIGPFMDRYFAGEGDSWLWLSLGVLAVILLVATLVTVLMVKEHPGSGGFRVPLLPTLSKTFKINVKAKNDFIWFLVSRLLIHMPLMILMTFGLYYLSDVIGMVTPARGMADFAIVAGIAMLAVAYPAGHLSDRVGRKPVVVFSGLLGALGIVVLFFSHSHSSALVAGGIIGISTGAFTSSNWALATDLVAQGEEAKYLGLTNLATAGGSALARLIGPVIDFFNAYRPNLGYSVMLLVCFICFFAGSMLVLRIRGRT